MISKIQLITYPDSLGSDLKDLNFVLNSYLKDVVKGVHILPFYPSSADRGFSPLTHLDVDPSYGDWNDINLIGENFELMFDFVMNHISLKSFYFQHYVIFGEDSFYADMFLTYDKVFGNILGDVSQALDKIYRPQPSEPFINVHFGDGQKRKIWTTFSPDQIDLDWNSDITKHIMESFLSKLKENKVKYLRLDAAGYVTKKSGSSCFFEKETYDHINWIKEILGDEIKLLPEVHHNYNLQLDIAENIDLTYDFQTPILMLHAIYFKTSKYLKNWINLRPQNMVTVLDTHDGIGIIDGRGLLSQEELDKTKSKLFEKGGNSTLRASGKNSKNLDVYQINCTYYSALDDDEAYLLARAIQFFMPGIPQIYYVGLFAGENDIKLLERTNHGRDINRHFYSLSEIESQIQKPVVKKLFALMRFRNNYEAFEGSFKIRESTDEILILEWTKEKQICRLDANIKENKFEINYTQIIDNKIVWKTLEKVIIPKLISKDFK